MAYLINPMHSCPQIKMFDTLGFSKIDVCFICDLLLIINSYNQQFYSTIGRRNLMYNNYKNVFGENYKCRLCSAHFKNPEELRIHRMVNHKGHMLVIKR
jgi:hypothetical protein